MRFRQCIPALLLGLLVCAGAAGEELYKWVDENGVVHYSQTPPDHLQSSTLEIESHAADEASRPGESVYSETIRQQQARRAARDEEKARKKTERGEMRKQAAGEAAVCSNARYRLNTLRKQCPVFIDEAGVLRDRCPGVHYVVGEEWVFISDAERAEMIERYSAIVADCDAKGR